MDCRQAREQMHETLCVSAPPGAPLEAHLAGCTVCREHFARLTALQGVVRSSTAAPVPDERLAEAVERARAQAVAGQRAARPGRPLAWAGAALAFGLCAFAGGLWTGRTACPREVTVVRTEVRYEPVERVIEKPVEVRVPVVEYRDRVVVRTVRVAAPAGPAAGERSTAVPGPGDGATAGALALAALQMQSMEPVVVSQEIVPARTLTPPPPTEPPADGPDGAAAPTRVRQVALAGGTASPVSCRSEGM